MTDSNHFPIRAHSAAAADMPVLLVAELGWETDNEQFVIGTAGGNVTPNMLKSLGTAKGDIIVYSASATPARLAVGSSGQQLTVGGEDVLIWATPFAGVKMKTGTYTGNGNDDRDIDISLELNITAYVWLVIKAETSNENGIHKFSHENGDATDFFGTVNQAANLIQSFTNTGFEVGTANQANQNAIVYNYVVFYEE